MKATFFTMAMTVLISTAQAEIPQTREFIYDKAAEELAQILNLEPARGDDRHFATSDGTLEISCIQGLRASCEIVGAFKGARLVIADQAAEDLMQVLAIDADQNGDRKFQTSDKSLTIRCILGLRASCSLTHNEAGETDQAAVQEIFRTTRLEELGLETAEWDEAPTPVQVQYAAALAQHKGMPILVGVPELKKRGELFVIVQRDDVSTFMTVFDQAGQLQFWTQGVHIVDSDGHIVEQLPRKLSFPEGSR